MKKNKILKWVLCIFFILLLYTSFFVKPTISTKCEDINISQYIVFDLYYGDVNITNSSYSGYNLNGNLISGTHSTSNKYYISQSNGNATVRDTNNFPIYNRITYEGRSWGEYITNNTDVLGVIEAWNSAASSVGRTETPEASKLNDNVVSGNADVNVPMNHRISIQGSSAVTTNFDITIDNVWSGFQNDDCKDANGNFYEGSYISDGPHYRKSGGISFRPENLTTTATIHLKGDNRFGNIHYEVGSGASAKEGSGRIQQLHFDNIDLVDNPATLTVGNLDGDTGYNHFCSIIGGANSPNYVPGLVFNGGIIYAGATEKDNCTAIGGGGCGFGGVTINGGIVTAVTASNGSAIGGGIGDGSNGGAADVYIAGGEVYAYNMGLAIEGTRESTSTLGALENAGYLVPGAEGDAKVCHVVMPVVAIGSGSSRRSTTLPATITIDGGTVYAQSIGGTAIGGGSSVNYDAGDAIINITGGSITAKSVPGNVKVIHEYDSGKYPTYVDTTEYVKASNSIGGGTAGIPFRYLRKSSFGSGTNEPIKDSNGNYQLIPYGSGGNAILNISGNETIIKAGSIGGGGTSDPKTDGTETGKLGSAEVEISGGNILGQIVMAAGSELPCTFTMTGGMIDNIEKTDEFIFLKENGWAVYVENGEATMSGGTIKNCSANNGGAVYVDGGNFTMTGGDISNNNAINGGAINISDGNFLMTSGKMTYNSATKEGGAVYVDGGNIVIGIEKCTDKNNLHETSKTHPDVTNNVAVYGGGGFITDGTITMYCGKLINNSSNNAGTGDNIYMNGGTFNLDGGTIGEETNPGVVLIGGELNDTRVKEVTGEEITMVYHSCLDSGVEHRVSVTLGRYVNVPAAQTGWTKEGHTMVGWTTIENAEVRAFEDYKSVGMAVKVDNADANKEIHYYAVWAKTTSTIAYNLGEGTLNGTNAETYDYSVISETLHLISPEKQYYNFIGWSLTASEGTKTNWETYYPEGEKSVFYSVEDPANGLDLNIGTHFGDITLTAVYEAIVSDIQININNSMTKNQSCILNIIGTPSNGNEFKTLKIATITDENGSSSVIIKDIPIGTYTVEFKDNWCWRYGLSENNIQSATNIIIDESQETYNVKFEEFTSKNKLWLNGYDF